MCGIAGIYRRVPFGRLDSSRIQEMAEVIRHRGPDDYGYLMLDSREGAFEVGQACIALGKNDVLLGNRRLSIIDLSIKGRQPISNEDQNVWIVHNGEVYNYIELRKVLEGKGHEFLSETDTEVIVHAYEEWGEGCVKRFNGMWAFAIWDQRKKEMFCSRDRFGIKPFYYYLDDEVFIFASEIKGILAALDRTSTPNYRAINDYLMKGKLCHSPETFFEGIRCLEPAHNFIISRDNVLKQRYWRYTDQSENYDYTNPVGAFRDLFHDAVRLRLRSDVPVGVTLSGGLDSTSVVAFCDKIRSKQKLKTFSGIFPGFKYDERQYIEFVSNRFNTEQYYIESQPEALIADLKKIIWHMDCPSLSPSVLPLWQVMRLASDHVKVVLEGQGADELLGGYVDKYFGAYLLDKVRNLSLNNSIITFKELLKASIENWRIYGALPFLYIVRKAIPGSHFVYKQLKGVNRVLSRDFKDAAKGQGASYIDDEPFNDRLTNELYHDHSRDILPHLLKYGDAISMAFSIESRLPFLDHRLVEFVFGLPFYQKLNNSSSKYIMRKAFKGIVPERILSRKDKIGFATPISQWLRENMDSIVRPLLLSQQSRERGVFNLKQLGKILRRHEKGQIDTSNYIYRWISLELWFRLFIDEDTSIEV